MDWCIVYEDNQLMICVYQYEGSGYHGKNIIKIPFSAIQEKMHELNLSLLYTEI